MINTSPWPWLAPSWRCALVTLVAVPLSFFAAFSAMTSGHKDFNAPSVAAYFFLCHLLVLPLALANSFLTAPYIAKAAWERLSAVGSHLILAAVWAGLIFSGYLVLPRFPAALDWLLGWVMLFWYLAMLLGPAVIAGSFVYSLKYNSMRRTLTSCA